MFLLEPDIAKAHREGDIHIHDFDYDVLHAVNIAGGVAGHFAENRGSFLRKQVQRSYLLHLAVDTLIYSVCLSEIFLCRHAETSSFSFFRSNSPFKSESIEYQFERKNFSILRLSCSADLSSGVYRSRSSASR